jgi:hypothetical protein
LEFGITVWRWAFTNEGTLHTLFTGNINLWDSQEMSLWKKHFVTGRGRNS